MIPRITGFLGCSPKPAVWSGEILDERFVRVRRALGIRLNDLAQLLGVDPGTLAKWERGGSESSADHGRRLEAIFETSSLAEHQ